MDENTLTRRSCEEALDAYVAGTPATVDGFMEAWLRGFFGVLPKGARVFELGSGTGRDAVFAREHYPKVSLTCSDAAASFLGLLRERGFPAVLFNVLEDAFPAGESYEGVLANAVLLHFTVDEFRKVLGKVRAALVSGGVFAFSLKVGVGSAWSVEKLGEPRFFTYWQQDAVERELYAAGYASWYVQEANGWLYVSALRYFEALYYYKCSKLCTTFRESNVP